MHSLLSDMNSSETSSKTHSPFKNASPRFRWHGAHLRVCRLRDTLDTWARPRGEQRQAKPAGCKHSGIQPVTQPRTQRDTERSPTAFTHFPTCILALCDIPPHALCDIPHMHSCVILADCARDSVQHGAHLHIDSHICRPAKDSA